MKRLLPILLILTLWVSMANSTATQGYRVSSTWTIGNDSSWVADSAVLYVFRDFADD